MEVTSITSSDTRRALQTAEVASKYLGIPIVQSDKLRSWNMGYMQGMLHATANPFLEFFEKNPDIKVPGGEAFRTFYNRFKGAFNASVAYVRKFPDARPAIFTHSQDLDLIDWFLRDIPPGRELEFGVSMKPGGILEVRVQGEDITMRKLKT